MKRVFGFQFSVFGKSISQVSGKGHATPGPDQESCY
jgi:hypothetical protein